MAARKSSRGKKGGARSSSRKGGAKKTAKRSAKKASARKASAKRRSAKKSPAKKKSATRRRPASRSASAKPRKSPIQRVTSVAKQVAQQAQAAVVGGVEALREMGGNIADRVGGQEQA